MIPMRHPGNDLTSQEAAPGDTQSSQTGVIPLDEKFRGGDRSSPMTWNCDECDKLGFERFYCNLCDLTFCEDCWNRCTPHRKGTLCPGGVPHEKTDHYVALKIRHTFECLRTDEEEEHLHQNDRVTTWFGVMRDKLEKPMFHDYGRYAALMEGVGKGHETCYPSLVSFVGITDLSIRSSFSICNTHASHRSR